MSLRPSFLILSSLCLLAAACDDPPSTGMRTGFGDLDDASLPDETDAREPDKDAGDDAGEQPAPVPEAPRPTYGVVSSDYVSTSVTLLDQFGELIAEDYINSGFTEAGLTTALSGDVALPTRSGERGKLTLLDRYKTDVITRLDLASGDILGQVRTHRSPPAGSTSQYSSNPHDYVYVSAQTAWVSRFEPNLDTGIPAIDRGTDLIRIDPSDMSLTEDHIDLSVLNTTGTRMNPDTQLPEEVPVYARPSRMVRLGNTLVVGLSRLSFDFTAAGDGMVAIVNIADGSVEGFALEGMQSCSDVVPVPGAADRVIVACAGFWAGDQRATSGLVALRITDGAAEIVNRLSPGDDAALPMAVNGPVALGGTLVGAVSTGSPARPATDTTPAVAGTPDVFSIVDLATGEATELFRGDGVYVVGGGSYDAQQKLLLVTDGSADSNGKPTSGVRRFSLAGAQPEELEMLPIAPALNLPVRGIKAL